MDLIKVTLNISHLWRKLLFIDHEWQVLMEARGHMQHAALYGSQTLEISNTKPTWRAAATQIQTDYHDGASCFQMLRTSRILHQSRCTWAFFQVVLYDYHFFLSRRISNSTTYLYSLKRCQFLSTTIIKCWQRDSTAAIFIHEQYITFKNRSCCTWWNEIVVLCL